MKEETSFEDVGEEKQNSPLESPKPQSFKVGLQMLFYGIASVLFWSILLIQAPFIDHYFGGKAVLFYIPLTYGLFSNVSRIAVIFLHSRSNRSTGEKLSQLIYLGASVTALGMCCLPVVMGVNGTDKPTIGFWLCMAIVSVVGLFNSLLVTGGFALMSLAPKGSGQFFLLGLTATGILTWPLFMLMRYIASTASEGEGVNFWVAVFSFGLSGSLCLLSIPMYRNATRTNDLMKTQLEQKSTDYDGHGLIAVFRKVWIPAVAMWVARLVTFALYPGMIGLYTPSGTTFPLNTYQSFLIYLGPLSDTVGQLVYRFSKLRDLIGLRGLIVLTAIRAVIIVPLFMLSAYMDGEDSFICQDWFRYLMMFGFSFSMGINYSAGNAIASQSVPTADQKFTVGVILSFVAMNGLFVGSLVGVGLKQLV
jgi:hypothetical protein